MTALKATWIGGICYIIEQDEHYNEYRIVAVTTNRGVSYVAQSAPRPASPSTGLPKNWIIV